MAIVVAMIGVLVTLLAATFVVSPVTMKWFGSRFRTPSALYAAVAIRLALGGLLFWAGPDCRPDARWVGLTVQAIGVSFVVAAVALWVVGPVRFRALIDWGLGQPPRLLRSWALVALVLGGFLIYAGL